MNEEEEKPISSYVDKNDKKFVTIFEKLRAPMWLVRIIIPESDEMKLFYIILGFIAAFSIWGAWDYGACHERNPECSLVECFGHNEPKPMRHK